METTHKVYATKPASLICLIISLAGILLYVTIVLEIRNSSATSTPFMTVGINRLPNNNKTKMIMFWTRRANRRNWFSFPENETSRNLSSITNCSHDCILTSDHSKLKSADLLLFYREEKPNWPNIRYIHQYYAHFTHESPSWNGRSGYIRQYEGMINITINFRRDADLYIPYNKILPIESSKVYEARIPHRNKTKMVVWPVSHCHTYSHREDYVKELAKYIDIDIYGACGKYKCSRDTQTACMKDWESKYLFYLSFENSICEDYITEKAFQPLRYELIPVVLGGGNYSRDTPPHSVINVRDFESPKDLADFLIHLAADEHRYRCYFKWKTQYKFVGGTEWFLCRLCEALHENKLPRRPAMTHYYDYWQGDHGEKCDDGLIARMRNRGNW